MCIAAQPPDRGTGEGVKSCNTRAARGKDFLISFYTGKRVCVATLVAQGNP